MKKLHFVTVIGVLTMLVTLSVGCKKDETNNNSTTTIKVTDIEGNVYNAIAIGNPVIGKQVWMVENLKTTKYNDGVDIPLVTDSAAWSTIHTPAYCWYDNDEATNKETYGALYNWHAVSTAKLCPEGWHIPTYTEWENLAFTFGGETIAGGYMKEPGTVHWSPPNIGATNESGFTALPGGIRYENGSFKEVSITGQFWTSQISYDSTYTFKRYISHGSAYCFHGVCEFNTGLSVRCVKD